MKIALCLLSILSGASAVNLRSAISERRRTTSESHTCLSLQDDFPLIPDSSCGCHAIGASRWSCPGPCYNKGCKTICETSTWHHGGEWPDGTLSCEGSGGNVNYVCCPPKTENGKIYPAKCQDSCKISKSTGGPENGSCCCNAGQGKRVISVGDFQYKTPSVVPPTTRNGDGSKLEVSSRFCGQNYGSTTKNIGTLSFSTTETQSQTWSFANKASISVEASIKTGVPFIADGKFTIKGTEEFDYGVSRTKTSTVTSSAQFSEDISPYTRQVIQITSQILTYDVPFEATATFMDTCGTRTTGPIDGSLTITGVVDNSTAGITAEIGPAVPQECKSPFDVPFDKQNTFSFCPSKPSDMCDDNPLCKRIGSLSGRNCSCTTDEALPCCATTQAHSKCAPYKNDLLFCPDAHGHFADCCGYDPSTGKYPAAAPTSDVYISQLQRKSRQEMYDDVSAAAAALPPQQCGVAF